MSIVGFIDPFLLSVVADVTGALDDEIEAKAKRRVDAKQKEIDANAEKYRNRLDDEQKSNEALRANVKGLEGIVEKLNRQVSYEQETKCFYFDMWRNTVDVLESVAAQNARLKRPLWVKIVGWLAR